MSKLAAGLTKTVVENALLNAKDMPAHADVTASKAETDRLALIKPAAEGVSLADITALFVAGKIAVGSKANTTEYNDGTGYGGNSYYARDAGSAGARPVADGGKYIHVGADGLYWEGIFQNGVWIEQFGAKPVIGFDNKAAVEKAAFYLGAGVLRAGYGFFEFELTAYTPVGVEIVGSSGNRGFDDTYNKSTAFGPTATATLTEDFVIFQNIDPAGDTETWVEEFPNNDSGGAKNLTIDGSNLAGGCNGFKFAGSHAFKNISNKKVKTLIAKPVGVYTDKVAIDQIHSINRANNTDYLIDLPGTGDGYEIKNIETGYLDGQTGLTKGISIGRCRSGQVVGLINGEHLFNGCKAVEVYGCHIEGGNITLKDCNAHVHDNILFTEEGVSGQIILESENDAFGNRYDVTLSNNLFDQSMNRRGGFQQTARPDIIIDNAFTVHLVNNKRKITDSSALSLHQYHGVLVGTSATTMLAAHNNYSHLFSNYKCLIIANQVVQSGVVPSQNKVFDGITLTTEAITDAAFNGASSTYYYHSQILQDPIRKIGRTGATGEKSIALTSGGNICKLAINWSTTVNRGCVILRVYRGVATGAYTQYADIPLVSAAVLYDTGVSISGFIWQARASGGVDSLNSGLNEAVVLDDGLATVRTTGALPSAGSWMQGDIVRRISITPPGSGLAVTCEYARLVTGSAHVSATDWLALKSTQG